MKNVWEGFRASAIFWTSNGSGFGGQIEKLKRATAIEAGKTKKTRKHRYLFLILSILFGVVLNTEARCST